MRQPKKVLLVGTSFSAVPLLLHLKEAGYAVYVCGGLYDDPCHIYANGSFYVDYSKKDDLLSLCVKEDFDYIIPSCNDFAYNSASYVATKLNKYMGFDDFDTTKLLHTKNGFRTFTNNNGLSAPRAVKYTKDTHLDKLSISYPLLVKPDDSFSGKGVTKVLDLDGLKEAVAVALENSKNGEIIIEEFIEGDLYSHSAFIQDGRIVLDFFVNEYCTVYPYQVDSSFVSRSLSEDIKNKVRVDIGNLVNKLSLVDGLLHTQFISNDKNFWLIETMRRCPGDLYGSLIQRTTNVNYAEFYCNPFLGEKNNFKNLNIDSNYIVRHTVSIDKSSIFISFKHRIPSENIDFYPLKESGQLLKEAPYDKIGILFCEFKSEVEMVRNTPIMKDLLLINSAKVVEK